MTGDKITTHYITVYFSDLRQPESLYTHSFITYFGLGDINGVAPSYTVEKKTLSFLSDSFIVGVK